MTEKFGDMFKIRKEGVEPVNHIAFILDISGSMSNVADEALDNFNTQLRKIRENTINQETYITLVMFDNNIEVKFAEKSANEVMELKKYPIGGTTALNDAIGKTISILDNDIPELSDETLDHSALIFVITDGYENSSKEFDKDSIKTLIEKYEKKDNWTITFMGGDIDVQGTAVAGMSMTTLNTMSFSNSKEGYDELKSAISSGIDTYYAARGVGMTKTSSFFNEETKSPTGKLLSPKPIEGEMLKDEVTGELLKTKKVEGKKLWGNDTLNEEEQEEEKLNE